MVQKPIPRELYDRASNDPLLPRIVEVMAEKEAIHRWLREKRHHENTALVDVNPDLMRPVAAQWVYSRGVSVKTRRRETIKTRRACAWVVSSDEHGRLLRETIGRTSSPPTTGARARDRNTWRLRWTPGEVVNGATLRDWWVYGSSADDRFCVEATRIRSNYERGWYSTRAVCLTTNPSPLPLSSSECPLLAGNQCGYWAQQNGMGGFRAKVFGAASLRGRYIYDSPVIVIDSDELPPRARMVSTAQLAELSRASLPSPWSDVFTKLAKWCKKGTARGRLATRLVGEIPALRADLEAEPFVPPATAAPLPNVADLMNSLRSDWLVTRDGGKARALAWLDKGGDGVVVSQPVRLEPGRRYALTTRAHPTYRQLLRDLGYSFTSPGDIMKHVWQQSAQRTASSRKQKVTETDLRRAARELKRQGVSVTARAVARRLGVSTSTVTRALVREGLTIDQVSWPSPATSLP